MSLITWIFEKICTYLTKQDDSGASAYLCDFNRICHEIIPGDVLLIEGNNTVSNIIKSVTLSRWSHAALYIGRIHSIEDHQMREKVRKHYHGSASEQLLLETIVGRGTEINCIKKYKNYHIRICRPSDLTHSDTQKVINYTINHLGNRYDTRLIMDLWRFLLARRWFIPRRWRSSLFAKLDSQAVQDVCSCLIAAAFMSVNFPILPLIRQSEQKTKNQFEIIHRNPKLYTPSDFDYSPYFNIIKYPMYPGIKTGLYQHLTWREELISHDDGVVEKNFDSKVIDRQE